MIDHTNADVQIEWLAAAYALRNDTLASDNTRRIHDAFQAAVDAPRETGRLVVIDLSPDDAFWLVQDLRLIAEDPDLFFIDQDGPMSIANRAIPGAIIEAYRMDEWCPPHINRDARKRIRAMARARIAERKDGES